jgi:multidrug efflux pump subunit AcrB
MTSWMVASSVRLNRLVIAIALAVLGFGVYQVRSAPVDAYPEFMPPTVQIQTEALGLSASEVEQLITVPVEQDLLNGVPWVDRITSESMTGLSSIDIVFEPGTDLLRARQMVQERLTQVAALPNVGSRPAMLQPVSSESRVMMIGLSSTSLSPIDMSVLARWQIRPRLMGIPGVANVSIWGQRDRQLQVLVDPARLRANGVTLDQVITSTGNAMWSSPLTFVEASTPGTGGFIDTANQRLGIQHILPITTAKQLSAVTIEDTVGRRLRLSDIADVVEDHQPLIGDALTDEGHGLMLVIQKFPDADTLQVTRDIESAMAAMAPGLSGMEYDTHAYRPATFLESSLRNVGIGGLVGLFLVVLVLGAFAFSWRSALISFVTIPLALVAAAYALFLRGTTFNAMTLAGLVVALGAVIDDAVVDVDSIRHRLRGRRQEDVADSVADGSREVRGPLVCATLVFLTVAVPISVQSGVSGAFSRAFATAWVLAVLASMLVALTVTPALSYLLLRGHPDPRRTSPLARAARSAFDRTVPGYVRRPRWAYATVSVLALAGLATLPAMGSGSLLPAPQDRHLLVQVGSAPGTSLQEMDRVTAAMSHELGSIAGVRDVSVHVGRAMTSDLLANVNSGELWVSLAPGADYARTVDSVRGVVGSYPGLSHDVLTYAEERLEAAEPTSTHAVTVRVFGEDLQVLAEKAEEVRRTLATIDGVVNPEVEARVVEPTLQVEVDLAAALRHRIRPGDVRRATATMLSGLLVGNLYEQQKIYDVVVWGAPATRANLTSVEDLVIDTPTGGHVRVGDVATVKVAPYPTVIKHEDISRSLDVTADVSGRSVRDVIQDATNRVHALRFPLEHHAEVLADIGRGRGSDQRMLGFALGALVAMYLLLQALTGSWRLALLMLLLAPAAGVGGLLTASFTGGLMSAGALMGLLLVVSLFLRNEVVLVDRCQRLASDGGGDAHALVVRATRDRLTPVLVSASTVAAAMVPFVALGTVAGTEILHPLAVVVLGGLVTSTLVTLFVVPALYLRFAPVKAPERPVAPTPVSRPEPNPEEAGHAAR